MAPGGPKPTSVAIAVNGSTPVGTSERPSIAFMRVDLPLLNSPSTETLNRPRSRRSANRAARDSTSRLPPLAIDNSRAASASRSSSLSVGTSYRVVRELRFSVGAIVLGEAQHPEAAGELHRPLDILSPAVRWAPDLGASTDLAAFRPGASMVPARHRPGFLRGPLAWLSMASPAALAIIRSGDEARREPRQLALMASTPVMEVGALVLVEDAVRAGGPGWSRSG